MGARSRLNGAYLTWSFLVALAAVVVSGSLVIGVFAFVVVAAIQVVAGNIRPTPRGWRP